MFFTVGTVLTRICEKTSRIRQIRTVLRYCLKKITWYGTVLCVVRYRFKIDSIQSSTILCRQISTALRYWLNCNFCLPDYSVHIRRHFYGPSATISTNDVGAKGYSNSKFEICKMPKLFVSRRIGATTDCKGQTESQSNGQESWRNAEHCSTLIACKTCRNIFEKIEFEVWRQKFISKFVTSLNSKLIFWSGLGIAGKL